MRRIASVALTVTIVVTGAAIAGAEPITITRDQRSTFAMAGSTTNSSQAGDSLHAVASSGAGAVSTSTLGSSFTNPMRQFGAGTISVTSNASGPDRAASTYFVWFTVNSPVAYTFNGSFSATSMFTSGDIGTDVQLSFDTGRRDEDNDIVFDSVFFIDSPHVFGNNSSAVNRSASGSLVPGDYVFLVGANRISESSNVTGSGSASFAFTFDATPVDVAPVPEPTSMLLLSGSLAGLVGYRRRSRGREHSPHS